MEDQLITFDTAKLAKESGYNISSIFHYDILGNKWAYDSGNRLDRVNDNSIIYAPTQSLLQRWLREKHNFHISIGLNLHGDNPKSFWISFENLLKGSIIDVKEHDYTTYEEALEIGLVEALKLIDDEVD